MEDSRLAMLAHPVLPDIIATATTLPSPPAVALELLRLTADDGATVGTSVPSSRATPFSPAGS
jgi:hypothetical protein